MMNIFIALFCLQIWTLERGFQVSAVPGTWTQHYEKPYSNLVKGGQQTTEPSGPTFICRCTLPQGVYPGKFQPSSDKCYVALKSEAECKGGRFEVLRKSRKRSYVWVDPTGSGNERKIRESAVEGGLGIGGKKLYICRTNTVTATDGSSKYSAILIGHVEEGGEECKATWVGYSRAYSDYQVLTDGSPAPPKCVPTERFETIHSVRNAGDSDQTITKEYVTGIERQKGSSHNFHHTETNTKSHGFSLGVDIKGIKAGFEASVGNSETTGFDWTKTSNDVWTHSTTHTLPINVKAGTHGILEQLVGVCGDVVIRTGHIELDSEPLDSEDLEE